MKINVIKHLAEKYKLADLKAAEEALMAGKNLAIDVEGTDEGEQLTHLLAAQEISVKIEAGTPINLAVREYTQRVRGSLN